MPKKTARHNKKKALFLIWADDVGEGRNPLQERRSTFNRVFTSNLIISPYRELSLIKTDSYSQTCFRKIIAAAGFLYALFPILGDDAKESGKLFYLLLPALVANKAFL